MRRQLAGRFARHSRPIGHVPVSVGAVVVRKLGSPNRPFDVQMLTISSLFLLLLPEVVLPRPVDLPSVAADTAELSRLAERLGPARLLRLAARPASADKGRVALLALRGLALAGSQQPELAAQVVLPLVDLLEQTPDEKLQKATADTLLRLCQVLGRSIRCEESDDLGCGGDLSVLPSRLLTLAEKPVLSPLLRSVAISALQALPVSSWQGLSPRLFALAQREPMPLRTTALAALSTLHQQVARPELLALVTQPDDELAAAASQELCWPLTLQKPARPQPGVAPVALVSDPVLLRVRAIAAGTQPIAVRLQTVDCLRVAGTQQDKALLLQLLTAAKAAKTRK